jgi:quercetin dioxygenase-like cupin family protein
LKRAKTHKKVPAYVADLARMVGYKRGSVISRELLNKRTGSVTLFSFDKGEGLSEHAAPYDAMVYVLGGAVRITISGKPYNLKKGEMIVMPARKPHALDALKKFKMLLVMIRS